jgi:DNA ligase-1
MTIKNIFDEIAAEPGSNKKMGILTKHKDNELLKRVLYLANSKRIKFYIKQIPEYTPGPCTMGLSEAIEDLDNLSDRTYTGHKAAEFLKNILSDLEPDNAFIIKRIIDKDCRIGMATANINKVFPNLLEKTGYMGCKPYSKDLVKKLFAKGKVMSQKKMDGRFVNVIVRGGEVEMESRQGEPTILDNSKFLEELKKLEDCVLNAELTMSGVIRQESNGLINSLITIAEKVREGKNVDKEIKKFESKNMPIPEALNLIQLTAWDKLTVDEYYDRSSNRPYHIRFEELEKTLVGFNMLSAVETKIVSTVEEAMEHFVSILNNKEEGTVLKSADGPWKDGKHSHQIKVKKEVNLDLRIVGFSLGTGKYSHVISSLNVESEDGLLKCSPAGMTEEKMDEVTANQDKLMGTIIEIKCSGISKDSKGNYSVLSPVFKIERPDKKKANTLAECIEIDKSSSLL